MNVEIFFKTLAKILSDKNEINIKVKVEKKEERDATESNKKLRRTV